MMRAEIRAKRDAFFAAIGQRPLVMGILNLTPDSFSDGGRFQSSDAALARARSMVSEGCAIVDVGAESTRPEATLVSAFDEIARLAPVLERIVQVVGVAISVDTYKAKVAAFAMQCGAAVINDVWGLQRDAAMADVVAETEAGVVIMHNRATKDESIDIVVDIRRFFDRSLALADRAGIPRQRILLDPGIGFGKSAVQNLAAIADLAKLADYGMPLLVGASRKGFLATLAGGGEARLPGAIAANIAAAANGASIFRVHDVALNLAALNVFSTIRRAATT